MDAPARTRVKICCIQDVDEAWMAVRAGADALGLVSAMPSGPGVIAEELIREIATAVPPPVATFLLTSKTDPVEIAAQHGRCGTTAIQLVDRLAPGAHRRLRAALPGVRLVQVVHVTGPESIREAREAAEEVDAVLLDSGNPALAVKELGGTGRTHDWALSARIRVALTVPVFLAGGLRPENAAAAVREVRPFALDVCSGVRAAGRLDPAKLKAFFAAVAVPRP
ncbi:MAG: phosphoribosylanthranilate isomerase [Candidatus Eisenbacteria bacterium]|nr:phosphoribosylanthranilate isomerase [Candidatus Eisenbacteria bacterium]